MSQAEINSRIAADWEFALECPEEFTPANRTQVSLTRVMRYVAALNTGVSRKEFVAAMEALGQKAHTAGIQFAQSRQCDAEMGVVFDKDGREVVTA